MQILSHIFHENEKGCVYAYTNMVADSTVDNLLCPGTPCMGSQDHPKSSLDHF